MERNFKISSRVSAACWWCFLGFGFLVHTNSKNHPPARQPASQVLVGGATHNNNCPVQASASCLHRAATLGLRLPLDAPLLPLFLSLSALSFFVSILLISLTILLLILCGGWDPLRIEPAAILPLTFCRLILFSDALFDFLWIPSR